MDIRERYEEKLLERLATEFPEDEILELCESKVVQLAAALDILKHTDAKDRKGATYEALIAPKMAGAMVTLEALQLLLGNVEEQELEFYQKIEYALDSRGEE